MKVTKFQQQAAAAEEFELRMYALLDQLEKEGAVRRLQDSYEVINHALYREVMGMEGPR